MADRIKKIDTGKGMMVFSFTKIYTVRGIIYLVSVFGRRSQSVFHMEKRDDRWRIVKAPQPPDWVRKHEEELGNFIEEQIVSSG